MNTYQKGTKVNLEVDVIARYVERLMLGEMAQLVLESQKVQSDQWHDLGFKFHFPSLAQALKDLL